jgi:hypothetical protein
MALNPILKSPLRRNVINALLAGLFFLACATAPVLVGARRSALDLASAPLRQVHELCQLTRTSADR